MESLTDFLCGRRGEELKLEMFVVSNPAVRLWWGGEGGGYEEGRWVT